MRKEPSGQSQTVRSPGGSISSGPPRDSGYLFPETNFTKPIGVWETGTSYLECQTGRYLITKILHSFPTLMYSFSYRAPELSVTG